MKSIVLRPVREGDTARLLDIYAPYVTDTVITFEYEVPTLAEFGSRVRSISADYPYLVCEMDGVVVGYAYAHRQMERAAYQWNAELSVYLDQKARGYGLGTALYGALLELLAQMGVRNAYGCVTLPNDASRNLHEKLGFVLSGVWRHSGFKRGAWHDVGWFERSVGTAAGAVPTPLRSIRAVPREVVSELLERYGQAASKGAVEPC